MHHVIRVAAVFLAAAALRADVTIGYIMDFKPGPIMPAEAAEQMQAAMKKDMPEFGMKVQVKGNRALTSMFGLQYISDFDGAILTILNTRTKKYSTAQANEYASWLEKKQGSVPPQGSEQAKRVFDSLKSTITARDTGNHPVVKGIKAAEREITLALDSPVAPEASMRLVFTVLSPDPNEFEKSAALRELEHFAGRAYAGTDPSSALKKAFGSNPGFAQGIQDLAKEMMKLRVLLDMKGAMYMPAMAEMMAARTGQPVDKNSPFLLLSETIEEFSSASIPDSVFDIPRDYTAVPMEQVFEGLSPGPRK